MREKAKVVIIGLSVLIIVVLVALSLPDQSATNATSAADDAPYSAVGQPAGAGVGSGTPVVQNPSSWDDLMADQTATAVAASQGAITTPTPSPARDVSPRGLATPAVGAALTAPRAIPIPAGP